MTSLLVSCSHTCTYCGATEGTECQVKAASSRQMLPSPAESTHIQQCQLVLVYVTNMGCWHQRSRIRAAMHLSSDTAGG